MSNIVIKLNLDNGQFSSSLSASKADLKEFKKSIGDVDSKLRQSERSTRSWGAALRDSVIIIGMSRHALMNLEAVFLSIPKSIIAASGEMERMTQLMKGLSTETGSYADTTKRAGEDLDYVFNLAGSSPFDVETLTDSFVKFRSVGLDPTKGSIQALVDSVAKFGGSKEQLHRASIAIQQMMGKTVVSMEELRQQLGEAVPDAIKIMSRGVAVSVAELTDQISKGTVAAEGALNALFRQMAIENSGAALEMSETWVGMLNRLETKMTLFKKQVGDAGYFNEVKDILEVIVNDLLSSPEANRFAKNLGEGLTLLVKGMRKALETIYEYRDEIKILAVALGVLAIKSKVAELATKAVQGAINGIGTAFYAATAAYKTNEAAAMRLQATQKMIAANAGAVAGAVKVQSIAMNQLTIAMKGVGAASSAAITGMRTLGATAVAAAGGWVTIITTAVIGLVSYLTLFHDKYREVVRELDKERPELIGKTEVQAIDEAIKKWDSLEQAVKDNKAGHAARNARAAFSRFKEEVGKTREELVKLKNDAALIEFNRKLEEVNRNLALESSRNLRGETNKYKEKIEEILENEKLSDKERLAQKRAADEEFKAIIKKHYDDRIAIQKEAYEAAYQKTKDYSSDEVTLARQRLDELKSLAQQALEVFDRDEGGITKSVQKETKDQNDALEKMFKKLSVEAEGAKAKLAGINTELEEFRYKVARGDFKLGDQIQVKKIEDLLVFLDKTEKQFKANAQGAKDLEKAIDSIDKIATSVETTFAKRENTNPFMKDALRANDFKVKLQQIQKEIGALNLGSEKILESVEALEKIDAVMSKLSGSATDSALSGFADAAEDIRNELLPEYQKIEMQNNKIISQLVEWRREQGETLSGKQETVYYNYLSALHQKKVHEMRTPIQKLADQWSDTTKAMGEIWASATDSFISTLADGLVEGELRFDSFLKSFAKMIVEMQLRAAAAGIIQYFTPTYNAEPSQVGGGGGAISNQMPMFANGGIMTSQGSIALQKYAKGGIANRPQLAMFGEGSQPEAYVPLPDGRTIPVTVNAQNATQNSPSVNFNLINQTGNNVEAVPQGEMKFDGEKMVMDVVLKNVSRPGKFRDSMKGALR